ncbi:hypothetical protein PMAYCL1PPCAC_12221, partial [Pristionchus mayeri]
KEEAAPLSVHVHKTPLRKVPAVSANRLPQSILIHIFQYLQLKDLRSCMISCRHWFNVLSQEDSLVWRSHALLSLPQCALSDSSLLAETKSYKAKLRALAHAWNPKDSSKHNYVRPNLLTMHRHPVAQSTDGIRGKRGVSSGVHAYEITWEGPLGTVAVVGVATKHAALHCPGYVALLGSDDQSWGWNLVDNSLLHNAEQLGVYPRVNNPPKYQVEERIRMIIDCDSKCVYFERSATSEFLGIAFSSLPPVKLFPAVCAVYGNTEVSMVYLGPATMG